MKLAQIGFGGIGNTVAACLAANETVRYVAIAARPKQREDVRNLLGDVTCVDTPSELLACDPDLVIECASHVALHQYAEPVLVSGIDLIAVSVGTLADRTYREGILAAAARSGARLEIPSGAIGGVDVVAAARHAGLARVTYITRKAPSLWKGTAAANMVDLARISEPVLFFDDTAERAAVLFSDKANVTATLALAGLGFEKTRVQFWVDHDYVRSTHQIELEAATGTMTVELANTVSPADKKSSWLTAMSIVQAVRNRYAVLRFV